MIRCSLLPSKHTHKCSSCKQHANLSVELENKTLQYFCESCLTTYKIYSNYLIAFRELRTSGKCYVDIPKQLICYNNPFYEYDILCRRLKQ
jgi:hypothetical protein